MPEMEGQYYEHGFKAKAAIPDVSYYSEEEPGYLEGHNASPSFKKVPYEAEGVGSKGPAAR